MKKFTILLGALVLMFLGTVAGADEHELPKHPHVLVIGLEFDEETETPISVDRCVDLAANQALRLNAQHDHLHFGTAGAALGDKGGHAVVPVAPFPGVPWTDCASLLEFFGL
ncbi:hypothetical protein [Salsipaludibacter albus]|uniref:hypothetical protein n=1 Tax=Salsipaludibacter albus TaxID=2849650 RepID=UPI001EE3E8A6|nr:hypothetical protein [Salsipaludibacter albus]MBY5163680.1 hypothetical protein [Salsipaludibacter albus]